MNRIQGPGKEISADSSDKPRGESYAAEEDEVILLRLPFDALRFVSNASASCQQREWNCDYQTLCHFHISSVKERTVCSSSDFPLHSANFPPRAIHIHYREPDEPPEP
jgi:hypothetical protein